MIDYSDYSNMMDLVDEIEIEIDRATSVLKSTEPPSSILLNTDFLRNRLTLLREIISGLSRE